MRVVNPSLRQQMIDAGLIAPFGVRMERHHPGAVGLPLDSWGHAIAEQDMRYRERDEDRGFKMAPLSVWLARPWPRPRTSRGSR